MTEETKGSEPVDNGTENFEDANEETQRQLPKPEPPPTNEQDGSTSPSPEKTEESDGEAEDETEVEKTNGGVLEPKSDDRGKSPAPSEKKQIDSADEISLKPSVEESTEESHRTSVTSIPEPEISKEPLPSPPAKRTIFGWFSRAQSSGGSIKSPPPLPPRRGTEASIMSVGSGADFSLNNAEPQEDAAATAAQKRENRISLRDRFKLARMRDEAGVAGEEEDDEVERPASPSKTRSAEVSAVLSGVEDELGGPGKRRSSSVARGPPPQVTVLEELPPGTAAGTSSGPAESSEPVDWDLWQSVVYEGPAAVARTSSEELSRAIANGIPSAIRGVIWQVLAQSKSEELEVIYRELVNRGKEAERKASLSRSMTPDLRRVSNTVIPEGAKAPGKEVKTGPSSQPPSVKSGASTPPSVTSPVTSPPMAYPETMGEESNHLDALAREQSSALEDEKARKSREDGLALQKLEKAIRRDLGARTSYSKFLMSAGLQDGLFGICKAYALFDEDVGYAQGMNFIAMPLLFNMPEEEAFSLFVRLMNQYRLRDMFIHEMPGLHLHLYQFARLLEDYEPALYCHLHRRGVHPQLYATQWFLTLFAYRFPLQLVLRIYDLILSEGLERAVLKFGICLMLKNSDKLREMKDMSTLTTFLKERIFDAYIDKTPSASSLLESGFFGSAGGIDKEVYRADELVKDACAIEITAEMLKSYTTEWEEKVREEKEKQAADDALRAANASLALRVRALEERCQTSDQEHVQMASEMVRGKVDNQRLADENESLKGQVAELQAIVQAQPGEVEERLKHEMDRIMKRNIEVQNENRALEESSAEMERELVQAKLRHAEINGELESMRQKWTNMTNLMKD